MATSKGKANAAIGNVTTDFRAAAKKIIATNPTASDKDIKARLTKLRYEQAANRAKKNPKRRYSVSHLIRSPRAENTSS